MEGRVGEEEEGEEEGGGWGLANRRGREGGARFAFVFR